MLVKIFDESHEKDLEEDVNNFLSSVDDFVDIKYSVAIMVSGEEQIYCYTAMIIYRNLSE